MAPSEYAKAALYKDLGVFSEPLDKRRRRWKRKRAQQPMAFERELYDEEPEQGEIDTGRGHSARMS